MALTEQKFQQAGIDAVNRDVSDKLKEVVSVKDFGAVGDGITDNRAAITACIAAASDKLILVPVDGAGGDYAITSGTLTIPSTARFEYEAGARIYAAGGTISDSGRHFYLFSGGAGEANSDDLVRGLNVSLLGGNAGSPVASTIAFNKLRVRKDSADSVTNTVGGTKVDGLLVYHDFGGASALGGRHAIEGVLQQSDVTGVTNIDRAYVGVAGSVSSAVGDGGGAGTEKGDYFGGNFVATLTSGATNTRNASAAEFNTTVNTGAATTYRSGIQIAAGGTERGSAYDAAISISNLGSGAANTVTWQNGILFGPQNGRHAFSSTSNLMRVIGPVTVNAMLDAADTTFTSGVILTADVNLKGNSLALKGTNAALELGGSASTSTIIDMHSSGQNNDYDARISGEGGTTNGTGGLAFFASSYSRFSGPVRPTVDNTITLGAPTFRWSVVYAGTGAINTSDDRLKTYMTINDAEVAVAKELRTQLRKFRFNDAISEKGDKARIHFGASAQIVAATFAKHGLDASDYALFCYDKWDAIPELLAPDGSVLQEPIEAGDRYGIRYDELLAFIISAI